MSGQIDSEAWEWANEDSNALQLARFATRRSRNWLRTGLNLLETADSPEGRKHIVRTIYNTLAAQQIKYAPPMLHWNEQIQNIRTPAEILGTHREGTCLDLALLFCGLCLGYDLMPLLILLDGHAFVAVNIARGLSRIGDPYAPEKLLFENQVVIMKDITGLWSLVKSGDFLPLECTGVARNPDGADELPDCPENRGREDRLLTFERAVEAGREQLELQGRPLRFFIDIARAQDKRSMTPLVIPGSPPQPPRPALFPVPRLPQHFIPRSEQAGAVKARLLSQSGPCVVGVWGMAGIGKSALAIDVVRSDEVREKFGEMIYWLTIRRNPAVSELQSQLIAELNQTDSLVYQSEIQAGAALEKALEGRPALLVLDDVWHHEHAEAFDVRKPWVRILVTTQNKDVLAALGSADCHLKELPTGDALRLLAAWAGTNAGELPPEAREVAAACENLPLALPILGRLARTGMSWSDLKARIDAVRFNRVANLSLRVESTHLALAAPFEVGVAELRPDARERYLDLAVFPGNVAIPEKPLADLWNLEPIDVRDLVRYLSNRCLLTDASPGEEGIRIHGLLRTMITAERESQLPELHRRLVDAWGSSQQRLDAYAWRWLGYHLLRAGRTRELSARLFDGAFARAKLQATDLDALISDYDLLPNHEILGLIREAMILSAFAVSRDPDQLAPQVIGRLLPYESIADVKSYAASLAAAAPRPWLRPRKPALQPPKAGLLFTLDTSPRRVNAVALSPDLKLRRLLSGEDDGTLRLVDLDSRRELYALAGNGRAVRAVAITPDGRFALSGGDDHLVWLRNLDDGSEVRSFAGHRGAVLAVAVTGHGSRAVSGSRDHTVRTWDLSGKGVTERPLTGHTDVVSAVAATPDGRFAVSGSWDGRVILWDLAAKRSLRTIEGDAAVSAIAITPDGRQCVWTSYDETLKVCDLQRRIGPTVLERNAGAAYAVAVTADSQHAVSSHGETLRWWDLKSGTVGRSLTGHSGAVWSIALTADGSFAVSADDRGLKVWDPRPIPVALPHPGRPGNIERHTGGVTGLAVSGDGKQAVSGSAAGELKLWNIESGRLVQTLQVLAAKVWSVALTPDGSRAVAGCGAAPSDGRGSLSGGTLEVWDLLSATRVHTLTGHAERITAVAVTPDGRRIISGSDDSTIRLWEIETGIVLAALQGQTDRVTSIALTPDGRHFVSGSGDGTIKLWDLESCQPIRTYYGQADAISAVIVTADGRRIISGSLDSTLKVWDLETGRELYPFEQVLGGPIYAVSLTHDNRYVVSASDDRTVRVWDIDNGKKVTSFFCDAAAWSCTTSPSSILAGDQSGNVYILALETGEVAS